jgi:hypothetical protein
MAEYIDREVLLAELQEEIDFKTLMYTEEQNQYFSAGLKCAYRDVKRQPTADVVPKSEEQHGASFYFQLEEIQERGKQLVRQHDAEVAREIFKEIERTCVDSFGNFYIGATHGAFAELKKKYTGGKNNEQRTE